MTKLNFSVPPKKDRYVEGKSKLRCLVRHRRLLLAFSTTKLVATRISHLSKVNPSCFTMKTVAALALLASTAAAFAPAQESRASTSLAAFEDALGAQKPLGFWYVCFCGPITCFYAMKTTYLTR